MRDYFPHLDKSLTHTSTKYKIEFCFFLKKFLFFTFPLISERTRNREVKSVEAFRMGNCDGRWNEYWKLKKIDEKKWGKNSFDTE